MTESAHSAPVLSLGGTEVDPPGSGLCRILRDLGLLSYTTFRALSDASDSQLA